jgi:conjugal transfer pilus assembly protein TrbC
MRKVQKTHSLASCATIVLLAAMVSPLGAQTLPVRDKHQAAQMPSDADLQKARQKAREAMGKLPEALRKQQSAGGASMPNINIIPKPAVAAPDLAEIAEKYKHMGKQPSAQHSQPDLMILVSLSMPKGAMERVLSQAELAGATLVFRGLKGDSMMRMGEEIAAIVGDRNVSAVVHPPAFQQFSVTRVPAFVIAMQEAGNVLDDGCSQPDTFIKVTGDVSLDYALEYIERKSPAWAGTANTFRSRIVRRIN